MKLKGGEQADAMMAHLGIDDSLARALPFIELTCLAFYIVPATSALGAILLAGYFGGAIFAHLRVGDMPVPPIALGVLAWLGLYRGRPGCGPSFRPDKAPIDSRLIHSTEDAMRRVFPILVAAIGCPAFADEPKLPDLPKPFETKSAVKFSKVVGWPADKKPIAPAGFTVALFADGLDSPRWMYQLPNGDVLVTEARTIPKPARKPEPEKKVGREEAKDIGGSANRITLFRPGKDGLPAERFVFAEGLRQPFGMSLIGDSLYIANTNAVLRFDYARGQTKLEGSGRKVLDLPEGGYNNHWTRNLLANKDGTKLYVTVGSSGCCDPPSGRSTPSARSLPIWFVLWRNRTSRPHSYSRCRAKSPIRLIPKALPESLGEDQPLGREPVFPGSEQGIPVFTTHRSNPKDPRDRLFFSGSGLPNRFRNRPG